MFGRVAITLGIGPHSSCCCCCVLSYLPFDCESFVWKIVIDTVNYLLNLVLSFVQSLTALICCSAKQ